MEALADMADGEKGGGIKVGQNLYQDVCWQPAGQVINVTKCNTSSDTNALKTESNEQLQLDVPI